MDFEIGSTNRISLVDSTAPNRLDVEAAYEYPQPINENNFPTPHGFVY